MWEIQLTRTKLTLILKSASLLNKDELQARHHSRDKIRYLVSKYVSLEAKRWVEGELTCAEVRRNGAAFLGRTSKTSTPYSVAHL